MLPVLVLASVLSADTPLVFAHRGASGSRPEHTMAAYVLGVEHGADAIEPDLVMTKDGHLIARHDLDLGNTTDVSARFADRKETRTVDGHTLPISAPYTRVPLGGTGPCLEVASFCDQGAGAPQLELMPQQVGGELHFVLTGAAPGATVALVGGQRDLPVTVPAGSLCIGGARRVIAQAQADSGGAADLLWFPGPVGWTALSSGQFAAQGLSQGLSARLSNALAIQTCP